MKLLHLTAEGLPLFKERLEVSFFARQRVMEGHKDMLCPLFSNVYMNPANGFIGINASGKTSVLKVILLALGIVNNQPINHIETRDILGDTERAVISTIFYSEPSGEMFRLETVITSTKGSTNHVTYRIVSESLWSKKPEHIVTKKTLLDFYNTPPIMTRNGQEDYLSDDVSIIIANNKKTNDHVHVVDLLRFTNINVLPSSSDIPAEIITFLDPTVEYLHFEHGERTPSIHLKFKAGDEIVLSDPAELNNYLSSGTIKGMVTFTLAQTTLREGGYLVVDELENHFNKEIVSTLLRFFMDSRLNKNGGTLIFSTHYPELLDEFDRNDAIFITRNQCGITVENLSNILTRNDIKKSDAYQSGYLAGTTPMYEAYMRLKKNVSSAIG